MDDHNTMMNDSRCASSNLAVVSTPSAPGRYRVIFDSEEKENIPEDFRMGRVQVVDGENHRGGAEVGQTFSLFKQDMEQRFDQQLADINHKLAVLSEANAAHNQRIAAQDDTIAARIQTNALQKQQLAAQIQTNTLQNQQLAAQIQTNMLQNQTNALQSQQLAVLSEANAAHNQQLAAHNQQLAAQIQTNALQNQRITSLTERSNDYVRRLDDAARAHNELQDTINQIGQRNADLTIDQGAIDVLMRAHDFAMCPLCSERYRATFCLPCMHTVCSDCCPTDQDFCPVCSAHIAVRYDLPY
jgi:hypothetical protein